MPRSSSKSKSLPPLPIVAAHVGTDGASSSSSAAPLLPQSHANGPGSSNSNSAAENPDSAASATTSARRRSYACIRTTVTLFVFGAYLVWTWSWHREHGFEGIPWLGLGAFHTHTP